MYTALPPDAFASEGAPSTVSQEPRALDAAQGAALPGSQDDGGQDDGGLEEYAGHLPPPDIHLTGTQLRKRLITPEVLAAIEAEPPRRSLLQKLLRRG
jgi:hypothetical protein